MEWFKERDTVKDPERSSFLASVLTRQAALLHICKGKSLSVSVCQASYCYNRPLCRLLIRVALLPCWRSQTGSSLMTCLMLSKLVTIAKRSLSSVAPAGCALETFSVLLSLLNTEAISITADVQRIATKANMHWEHGAHSVDGTYFCQTLNEQKQAELQDWPLLEVILHISAIMGSLPELDVFRATVPGKVDQAKAKEGISFYIFSIYTKAEKLAPVCLAQLELQMFPCSSVYSNCCGCSNSCKVEYTLCRWCFSWVQWR